MPAAESRPGYLAHVRLDAATDLLRDTSLSATHIAENVGCTSAAAFSRAFKTATARRRLADDGTRKRGARDRYRFSAAAARPPAIGPSPGTMPSPAVTVPDEKAAGVAPGAGGSRRTGW